MQTQVEIHKAARNVLVVSKKKALKHHHRSITLLKLCCHSIKHIINHENKPMEYYQRILKQLFWIPFLYI